MKLFELEQKNKGTYAGVKFSDKTKNDLIDYGKENNINNVTPKNKLHTTLLYSRKHLQNYKAAGKLDEPLIGEFDSFDIWQSQPDEDGNKSNCLILKYKCPELVQRHKDLMNEHKATFDYPKYTCHITLSYDCGDLDVDKLPDFEHDIEIDKEYRNDLDLDWATNNKCKS